MEIFFMKNRRTKEIIVLIEDGRLFEFSTRHWRISRQCLFSSKGWQSARKGVTPQKEQEKKRAPK
jgi:hypothetical protein